MGRGRVAGSRKEGALRRRTRKTGRRDGRPRLAVPSRQRAGSSGDGARGARRMQGMGRREVEDRERARTLRHSSSLVGVRSRALAFAPASDLRADHTMIIVIHVRDKRQGPILEP